MVINKIRYKKR